MKNIKRKIKRIDSKALIVTADCSKGNHHGYFRSPDGDDVTPFKFNNSRSGFELFWQRAEKFRRTHGLERIIFGFESTGSYSYCLAVFMLKQGSTVYQVNPQHSKRLKELEGNSPNKTDKKDPKVIADILMLNHGLTFLMPQGAIAELRKMILNRERINEDINRVKNRMEAQIVLFFPEFLSVMKGLRGKSSLYLLQHHPMPCEILKLGRERLTAILSKVSRKRLGKLRAEALYTAAQATVGITEGLLAMGETMRMLMEGLNLLEDQLKRVEGHIRQLAEGMPAHGILTSMKGIGLISSATIMAEVVDFNFYHSASELLKLAGLDLYEISSGKHKGRLRISKRGRSLLRKVLYFASLNMVKKGGIFHEIYQIYRGKGKPGPKALIAISRKLLRTIFSMVKNNVVYNPDFKKLQLAA